MFIQFQQNLLDYLEFDILSIYGYFNVILLFLVMRHVVQILLRFTIAVTAFTTRRHGGL